MNWLSYLTIILAKIDDWLVDLTFFGLLSPYKDKKEEVIEDEIKIHNKEPRYFPIPDDDDEESNDEIMPWQFEALNRTTQGYLYQ